MPKADERLRTLCELAVQEEDPEALLVLVRQIEEAIDGKLASLRKSDSGVSRRYEGHRRSTQGFNSPTR
jgi:hypothetical protein